MEKQKNLVQTVTVNGETRYVFIRPEDNDVVFVDVTDPKNATEFLRLKMPMQKSWDITSFFGKQIMDAYYKWSINGIG